MLRAKTIERCYWCILRFSSIWFRINHKIFKRVYLQSVRKIMGKIAIWTVFSFYPFSFLTLMRNNKQNCVKICYGFAVLYRGRGRVFKHTFQNSHNILSLTHQWKKLWEKLLSGEVRISTPFCLLTMLRNNEQNLHQAVKSTVYMVALK